MKKAFFLLATTFAIFVAPMFAASYYGASASAMISNFQSDPIQAQAFWSKHQVLRLSGRISQITQAFDGTTMVYLENDAIVVYTHSPLKKNWRLGSNAVFYGRCTGFFPSFDGQKKLGGDSGGCIKFHGTTEAP